MNGFHVVAYVGPEPEAPGSFATLTLTLFLAEPHTEAQILHANL
jgi:hypothetical protein